MVYLDSTLFSEEPKKLIGLLHVTNSPGAVWQQLPAAWLGGVGVPFVVLSGFVLQLFFIGALLTCYALGLDEISAEAPTIRTFYNLRRRVRKYAEETSINLYNEVFARITDEQIAKFLVKTNWQRMDIAEQYRPTESLGTGHCHIAKGSTGIARGKATGVGASLSKTPQNICYRLKDEAVEEHLQTVGLLLVTLLAELQASEAPSDIIEIVTRVIGDQYQLVAKSPIQLKPTNQISATSVPSPHDPEVTYRYKHEQGYQGYVVNLSETCDPENDVQLITSVQTAASCIDDGQMLADSLDELTQRQVAVDQVTVDGGYNGSTSEKACRQHRVKLRPTTIRGGKQKQASGVGKRMSGH